MKLIAHLRSALLLWRKGFRWQRFCQDTLLASAGVVLVTALLETVHLYLFPRIQTISLLYLIVIMALASTRGLYAAILATLLTSFTVDYFFVQPFYSMAFLQAEDVLTLCVFLVAAILTSQLASALRRRVEQAGERERELRRLYEQAKELAALQERQRLARELHDSVSQVLYSMSLGAHTVLDTLQEKEYEQAQASTEYVLKLAEAGLAEMRALIFELRPESLEREGLVAALNRQVAVLRTRHKLAVECEVEEEPDLPLEHKEALYRIAQEALHNIIKHARASSVSLRLLVSEDELLLVVRDNGRGFETSGAFPGHLGLRSMQERVARTGGTLSVESAPGQGTTIRVRLPRSLKTGETLLPV